MPIRAYLGGLRFDPETTRLMAIAFEMALVALQRTDGIVNPTREAVAKRSSSLRKLVSATRSVYATRPCSRCGQAPSDNQRPQSSSASRLTAGASGFLNLSQSGEACRRMLSAHLVGADRCSGSRFR